MQNKLATGILVVAVFLFIGLTAFLVKITQPSVDEIHPVVLVTLEGESGHASAVHIGNGYFLTANHFVKSDIQIYLAKDVEATLLWTSTLYDIAYLYAPELDHINHYELSCAELKVGDLLEFHGNPSDLESISTWGRVAGAARQLEDSIWETVVPVNANIIPGMSGGSVTNMNNELVGINIGAQVIPMAFGLSLTGISYIIPSSTICQLLTNNH